MHGVRKLALLFGVAALVLAGCATSPCVSERSFAFGQDTFAYENELKWEYFRDSDGKWTTRARIPPPNYSLHCFPVAKAAKVFFVNARFDPAQPPPNEKDLRRLIHRVARQNPRRALPEEKKVVIPGYANLNELSRAHETMLKKECGSAVSSYFQRGHWRMVMPVTARQREKIAERLVQRLKDKCPTVVHVFTFPSLKINHALLVYDCKVEGKDILLEYYDPNDSEKPWWIRFDSSKRKFYMDHNAYFPGGEVQIYEVFHQWNY